MNSQIAQRIERLALLSAVALALAGAGGCGSTPLQPDAGPGAGASSRGGRGGIDGGAGGAAGAGGTCDGSIERLFCLPGSGATVDTCGDFLVEATCSGGQWVCPAGQGCSDAVPVPWSRVPDLCLHERRLAVRDRRRGRAGRHRRRGLLVSSPLLRRHRQPRHVQRHGDARDLPGGAVGLPAVGGKSRAVSVLRSSATRVRLHRQRLSMRDGRRRRTGRRRWARRRRRTERRGRARRHRRTERRKWRRGRGWQRRSVRGRHDAREM